MTAYAIVIGVVTRAPIQKISKAGKPYTTCTVNAGSDDSAAGDYWSVLSFSESSQLELLRLEIGDAVAVRGKLELKTYTAGDGSTKIGRTIFCDAAIGLRPVPRTQKKAAKAAPSQDQSTTTTATSPDFDDGVPL